MRKMRRVKDPKPKWAAVHASGFLKTLFVPVQFCFLAFLALVEVRMFVHVELRAIYHTVVSSQAGVETCIAVSRGEGMNALVQ